MISFELGKEIEKDVFRLVTSLGQRKNSESPWVIEPQTFGFRARMLYHRATETKVSAESEGLRFNSSWGIKNVFLFPTLVTRRKTTFYISLRSSKKYHISCSIYKHDAIDVADPSSMQDARHMNFVDFPHCSLCGSVVAHRSAGSEGLGFESLFHAVTRRKISLSKNSYFHINLIQVEQRRNAIIFPRAFELCLFLDWQLQRWQFPSSPLLCQESCC